MSALVLDPKMVANLQAARQQNGSDRYDEVWEGVYVMPPMPNDEHQQIVMRLGAILQDELGWPGLAEIRTGVNLSDRAEDWQHNYRVPDIAVFFKGTSASNWGTHWQGPPDLVIEVISPYDQTRDKTPFYTALGVREVLLIDRDPWQLELYRHDGKELALVGTVTVAQGETLASATVPLSFALHAYTARPVIQVVQSQSGARWQV